MEFYNKMLEENGSNVVWMGKNYKGEDEYNFSVGDRLLSDEENGWKFEKRCEGNENIECMVGMGDDVMNCIIVVDVDLLDEVEKEFIEEYCGSNCYSW